MACGAGGYGKCPERRIYWYFLISFYIDEPRPKKKTSFNVTHVLHMKHDWDTAGGF